MYTHGNSPLSYDKPIARLRLTQPCCARVQWARTGGEGHAPPENPSAISVKHG